MGKDQTKCYFIFLFIILCTPLFCQNFIPSIGLSCNIGKVKQRVGVQASITCVFENIQLDLGTRYYFNDKTFGPPIKRSEWQLNAGIHVGLGNEFENDSKFTHLNTNQTHRQYSVGYGRTFYLEKVTQQQTGTISLNFGNFEIVHENDALSFEGKDRFRTGAIRFSYQIEDTRIALTSILWHGNTHGPKVKKIMERGTYKCRHGYKDLSQAHCGKYSHGILAFEIQQYLPFRQSVQFSMGVDSEKVRHTYQNKLIHDSPLIPEKMARNPHYPMLDVEGNPYLFKEGQVVKPGSFYFDLGLNATLFY